MIFVYLMSRLMKGIRLNASFLIAVKLFLFCLLVTGLQAAQAAEICDNGIDDDGDGMVDCADPECSGYTGCELAITCGESFFQVVDGNTLKVLDAATGTYTTIGTSSTNYNGAGYNVQDGYIYGIGSGAVLLRIDNTGASTNLGAISGFYGASHVADFDTDGNWHSVGYTSGNWYYTTIDVSELPPVLTYENLTISGSMTLTSGPADITVNPVTGMYYGMNGGKLIEVDPIAKTVAEIGDYSSLTGSGGFGAAWSDVNGDSYFYKNGDGSIYKATFNGDGTVATFNYLATSLPNGNNDGMNCSLSEPPVFPEECGNGVDDDGDGLIDGADPDCFVSSGGEGGLESNGRLSSLISDRNYTRLINGTAGRSYNTAEQKITRPAAYGRANADRSSVTIDQLIPIDAIDGTQSYISSPTDLLDITNANEIYSVDIHDANEARLASVLAISTEETVYEHTKYICDRLRGAAIEQITTTTVDGHDILITAISQPQGYMEYVASFAAYMNDGSDYFTAESHWRRDDYGTQEEWFNFQIWARTVNDLHALVGEIFHLMEVQAPIAEVITGEEPAVYVKSGTYLNGVLELEMTNTSGSEAMNVYGTKASTEHAERESFQTTQMLSGATNQIIQIETGSLFDIGCSFNVEGIGVTDGIYMADGAWGLEYSQSGASIEDFTIETPTSIQYPTAESFPIDRDIKLEAELTEYVTVYRAIRPSFRATNMEAYNNLSFDFTGEGNVEVTIVKSSISDWSEQYRANVQLSAQDTRTINLSKQLFSNGTDEPMNWEDVKMVAFTFKGDWETTDHLSLEIANLAFKSSEEETTGLPAQTYESLCAPNPFQGETQVLFSTPESGNYTFIMTNTTGQQIYAVDGRHTAGTNVLQLNATDIKEGLYTYHIHFESGHISMGKMLLMR